MIAISSCLAVVGCLCTAALPARAQENQGNTVERQIAAVPGRDKRFGLYINTRPDCSSGPLPAIRLVTPPAHGTVTVKRGAFKATNFKQCLAIEVPALIAFYHAPANFKGTDEFELGVTFAGGREQMEHFRVDVFDNQSGGRAL